MVTAGPIVIVIHLNRGLNMPKLKFLLRDRTIIATAGPIVSGVIHLKGIVSRDWKGLQMVSLDRFEV
jgi:hypothetical protein